MGQQVADLNFNVGLELIRQVEASRGGLQNVVAAGIWWCEHGRLVEQALRRYAGHLGDARRLLDGLVQVLGHLTGGDENPVYVELAAAVAEFQGRFPLSPDQAPRSPQP